MGVHHRHKRVTPRVVSVAVKAGWSLGSRAEPGRWLILIGVNGKGKGDIIGFFGLHLWPRAALLYIHSGSRIS